MKSHIETVSETRVKFIVEIPPEEFQPHINAAYAHFSAEGEVPGFKKGKVPPRVIDRMFGRGAVLEEAVNEAVPRAYEAVLLQNDLVPQGAPEFEVTNVDGDPPMVKFTAEVDIRPKFDLPAYSCLKITVSNLASDWRPFDYSCIQQRGQSSLDRDLVLHFLLESVDIPVLESVIAEEAQDHFVDCLMTDSNHRVEVEQKARLILKSNFILDTIAGKEDISTDEQDLSVWLTRQGERYGISPDELAQAVVDGEQVPLAIQSLRREKALTLVVDAASFIDQKGNNITLHTLRTGRVLH